MKYLPDVLIILGAGAVIYGMYRIYPPAAWILAGIGVIAIGLVAAKQEGRIIQYRSAR